MARPPDPQRNEAIATINRQVAAHGAKKGLRLAREEFSDVPHATWARWRQAAIGSVIEADAGVVVGLASEVRAEIPTLQELAPVADPVPATHRAINFWKMLEELEADAQLMRDFALARGADGKVKLRVPPALRDAHRMRCDLIKLALQQAEVAWSSDRAATFFQTIVDAIGEESPACQRRIMERLRLVQGEAAARGF